MSSVKTLSRCHHTMFLFNGRATVLSNATIFSLKERVKFKTEQVVKFSKLLEYKPAKLESREFGHCFLVNSSFCMRSEDEGISELSDHTGVYTYAGPSRLMQEFGLYRLPGQKKRHLQIQSLKAYFDNRAQGSLEGSKVSQAHRRR